MMATTYWCCLYDKQMQPLGQWTQHIVSSYTLTRNAFDFDEFELTCKGWENSADACYVGLHDKFGGLVYLGFCGIPTTEDNLTTITATDVRRLLDQDVTVDFSQTKATLSGTQYVINTVAGLYEYLFGDILFGQFQNFGLTIGYDLSDIEEGYAPEWHEEYMERTCEVRNLWEIVQSINSYYDLVLEVVTKVVDNVYVPTFTVKRIANRINIKLGNYNYSLEQNTNITNRAIAQTATYPTDAAKRIMFALGKDNSIAQYSFDEYDNLEAYGAYMSDLVCFPPKTETFEEDPEDYEDDDDLDDYDGYFDDLGFVGIDVGGLSQEETKALATAVTSALETLADNRYQSRVDIDLNSRFGHTLKNVDFTYFAEIAGYNPADSDSEIELPVYSISEDGDGNGKITFGRLSDYWFMDDR